MKKAILTCVFNAVLLTVLCLPADARVVIGLSPVASLSEVDRPTLDQLGDRLGTLAKTTVSLRRFDNNADITNWLLRFQEIDAAVVAPGYIKQQPTGALIHLVDLHTEDVKTPPLALVIRNNTAENRANQIKNAFLALSEASDGREILQKAGLKEATSPGQAFRTKTIEAEPERIQSAVQTPPPSVEAKQPKVSEPHELVSSVEVLPDDKRLAVVEAKEPSKKEGNVSLANPVKLPAKMQPAAQPAEQPATQREVETGSGLLQTLKRINNKQKTEETAQLVKREKRAETSKKKEFTGKDIVLSVILIILVAIAFKLYFLLVKWKNSRKARFSQEAPLTMASALESKDIKTSAEDQDAGPHGVSQPSEETVSIELAGLILEASHLQPELPTTLQEFPDLTVALDFCPDGRDKLEKISLSVQQQATLALVNGKRSINDLCVESNMMDYEVHRFLYLMVKAGVLKQLATGS